jgi:hypothetical protein
MMLVAIGMEHPLDVTVQRPQLEAKGDPVKEGHAAITVGVRISGSQREAEARHVLGHRNGRASNCDCAGAWAAKTAESRDSCS